MIIRMRLQDVDCNDLLSSRIADISASAVAVEILLSGLAAMAAMEKKKDNQFSLSCRRLCVAVGDNGRHTHAPPFVMIDKIWRTDH